MISFLGRRLAWAFLVLWVVVSASFLLAWVVPSDPARTMAGAHASEEVIERIRKEHHLDEPLWMQYGRYVAGVAHGDLGRTYRTEEPVTQALAHAFPYTALIAVGASLFQWLVGVPLGLYSALNRGKKRDVAVMASALIGFSAPTFVVGLMLMIGFGYYTRMFPIGGTEPGVLGMLRAAVLPSATLAAAGAAYYAQLVRGEYIDVSKRDYMRTAIAKGLPRSRVIFGHGLPNALLPVVTLFGMDLGAMLGGAVVTESVFAWPGVGRLAVESVVNKDIPLLLGTVLLASACVVLANLAVDIAYAVLDPRIRVG